MKQALAKYSNDLKRISMSPSHVKRELFTAKYHYKWTYEEYFMFHYYLLNVTGRKSFVGDFERIEILDQIGTDESRNTLDNKYLCHKKFEKYYHREVIHLPEERENFSSFAARHPSFIVKPINQGGGKGVFKVNLDQSSSDIDEIYTEQIEKIGSCVIEECIDQDPSFSSFHPNSVNTLRIVTFRRNGNVDLLFAFLRFGRDNSCVDNGALGGIIASVDLDSGIVNSVGRTEDNHVFTVHPNTGKQIIGFRIPEWEAAVSLSKELADILPDHPCIGWDLAYTANGWIMVEGNRRTMFVGPQLTLKVGLRPLISTYFGNHSE